MLKPTSRLKEPPLKALAVLLTGIAVSPPAVAQTRYEGQTNRPADSSTAYRLLFATALEADSQYRVDIGTSQDHDGSVKVDVRSESEASRGIFEQQPVGQRAARPTAAMRNFRRMP